MLESQARDDLAFIRRALEEGRSYATARSPDMVVWGIAVALGDLGAYACLRGWLPIAPRWVWIICIGLPWIYSLRRLLRRGRPQRNPMARAMAMLWLGLGIFLTTLAFAAGSTDSLRDGWFAGVAAGALGVGFFASAWLTDLAWLRSIAAAWWLAQFALFALRHRLEVLPLCAALMLLLLAGPGLVLLRRHHAPRRV